MSYRVLVWCPDCTGTDDLGCFGGDSEFLDEVFDTREEAVAAGERVVRDGIWRYDVEEVE